MLSYEATSYKWSLFAKVLGFDSEEEMLREMYSEMSLQEIGDILGLSKVHIFFRMKKYGICRRQRENQYTLAKLKKEVTSG